MAVTSATVALQRKPQAHLWPHIKSRFQKKCSTSNWMVFYQWNSQICSCCEPAESVHFEVESGELVSHKRDGDPGKAPYQIQRKVRWGGRQSMQAQLSLTAVLGNSTRFQIMQHNCWLGHKACMFTALILHQCCPRKTQAAGRKHRFLAAKAS